MNKNKNRIFSAIVCGALVTISGLAHSQREEVADSSTASIEQTQAVQDIDGEAFTVLSDRIHQINQTLQSVTAVHRYSFTSVRGQDVLLATPGLNVNNSKWAVEYQTAGGPWRLKRFNSPEAIRSLKPGDKVNIRIKAVDGARFETSAYSVVLGSYPHMRYDFHHEEGFLKIPHGLTKPPFLATQAYTKALLEGTFTDSKGYPLEGGVMRFEFRPNPEMGKTTETFTSDHSGRIVELIEFSRCEGGDRAGSFVHKHNGRNTWSTLYKVGEYAAHNLLLESLADKPHQYDFGHICKRTLINWSRK